MSFFRKELNSNNKEIIKKVKHWVKMYFGLPDEGCKILVTELSCVEESCPDLETVISILLRNETKVFRINKSIISLKTNDIEKLSIEYLTMNVITK